MLALICCVHPSVHLGQNPPLRSNICPKTSQTVLAALSFGLSPQSNKPE